jgi:hypothetical protein
MNMRVQSPAKPASASPPSFSSRASAALLQRKCACGGSAGSSGECAECKKKKTLQRRAKSDAKPGSAPPIVHEVLRSPGQPLDAATRAFMEPRFGHDFGKVRIHADGRAAASAEAVNAFAYTAGQHMVFAADRFRPGTGEGNRLLAHELTHVVQQSNGAASAPFNPEHPLPVGPSADSDEQEAERAASAIAGTEAFRMAGSAAGSLQQLKGGEPGGVPPGSNAEPSPTQTPVPAPAPSGAPALPKGSIESITSETLAITPGARTRTTIGVGEIVSLTHMVTPPPAQTPAPRGPGPGGPGPSSAPGGPVPTSTVWKTTAGIIGPDSSGVTNLVAPDTARSVTVTGGTATIPFNVIAPNDVKMDREPGFPVKHNNNTAVCGILTRVFLGPDNVNFSRVIYHEIDAAGVPTDPGAWACSAASSNHCGVGAGRPCADKSMTSTVVSGMGTQSERGDCAVSGSCNCVDDTGTFKANVCRPDPTPAPGPGPAPSAPTPAPTAPAPSAPTPAPPTPAPAPNRPVLTTPAPRFIPGSITTSIPYEYKVDDSAFHRFRTVPQTSALAADALTLTTEKAGARGTIKVTAPDVPLAACTFP